MVPFADSEELVRNTDLPAGALIEVGSAQRLADAEPLAAMLGVAERFYEPSPKRVDDENGPAVMKSTTING